MGWDERAPALASSKGYLLAMADGVSQCSDGALAAQSSLQALAMQMPPVTAMALTCLRPSLALSTEKVDTR